MAMLTMSAVENGIFELAFELSPLSVAVTFTFEVSGAQSSLLDSVTVGSMAVPVIIVVGFAIVVVVGFVVFVVVLMGLVVAVDVAVVPAAMVEAATVEANVVLQLADITRSPFPEDTATNKPLPNVTLRQSDSAAEARLHSMPSGLVITLPV
jgi:hypothetical protein